MSNDSQDLMSVGCAAMLIVALLGLCAIIGVNSGYSARGSEMTGQVKRVVQNTPLVCQNYTNADISLGSMRAGVGSMSTEDVWVTVPDASMAKILADASVSGKLVKVTYDVRRLTICIDDHIVTAVEVLK